MIAGSGLQRRSLLVAALGVIPAVWTAWLLWIAPIDGLTADRTALATRDFSALWAAGKAAAEHSLALLSDPAGFNAYLRALFGPGMPSQIWPYPPSILLLARPLAELPLGPSFVVYSALSAAALWLALSVGRVSPLARAAVLLSPAVTTNALTGQNGALITAVLCAGLLLIDRRPLLSGLLLGAISIKPQFGLLLPICLLASARWRTALFGCVGSFTLACAAGYAFGYTPWLDFLSRNQTVVSTYIGAPWQSDPAQLIFSSAFMASRALGAGLTAAYAIQSIVTCGCACAIWCIWRDPRFDATHRTAATLPLILLAAPWVHTYDMPALAVSVVLLLPGTNSTQRILLAWAWLWPGLPPLVPVPPVLTVLSIASVAWMAGTSVRHGCCEPQPA